MERGVVTYSAVYITGIMVGLFTVMTPVLPISILALLLFASFRTKTNRLIFLTLTHLALFIAGTGAASIALQGEPLPHNRLIATISTKGEQAQALAVNYLAKLIPDKQEHATLCALAVGEKGLMGKDLKESFSRAGAMHVLALSGLHIGILFSIIYRMLSVLCIIPGGNILRNVTALVFIIGYTIFSGCSPSVLRAAFMILIYRVAGLSYRVAGKWNTLALSAFAIAVINPLEIKKIGFQLSYAAAIGIIVFYPVCRTSFKQLSRHLRLNSWFVAGAEKLWESISISVCCQIATLPFVLYWFGKIPEWFLLGNLVAVPSATAILYLTVFAVAVQWIPVLGDFATELLSLAIRCLNASARYIS